MKAAVVAARILLGLIFLVFGLNGFFVFVPVPELKGHAGTFMGVLVASRYLYVVKTIEIVAGALLLGNRYVPGALALLGPVIFNIVLFHLLMDPQLIPAAVLVTALWGFLLWVYRRNFAGLFERRPTI